MRYAEDNASALVITDVTSQVDERFCTLRWRWPDGVQAVYIHKTSAEEASIGTGDIPPVGMKLYTREEYKSNNGYRDRLDEIGLVSYTIYARLAENGETLLVRQSDGANRVVVSAGKARIYYSVQQKEDYSENKRPYIWRLRQKFQWLEMSSVMLRNGEDIRQGKRMVFSFPLYRISPLDAMYSRRLRSVRMILYASFSPTVLSMGFITSWCRSKISLCVQTSVGQCLSIARYADTTFGRMSRCLFLAVL